MSTLWRSCRGFRLRAPSAVSRRNRCSLYFTIFVLFVVMVLLIPGGEIAVYKYVPGNGKHFFLTVFSRHQQSPGDDSAALVREQRSLPTNKVLLLWSPHDDAHTWHVTYDPFSLCPVSACELTSDKQRVSEADAVLFSTRGLTSYEDLPPEHPPWQVWILHNSDPPYNIHFDFHQYDNVFNWTSWYRHDADIHSPSGDYEERPATTTVANSNEDDLLDPSEDGQVEPEVVDPHSLHDRSVFVVVNTCRDMARRYTKVAALRQHLPVDTFGDCGDIRCSGTQEECEQTWARYRFVLAFEGGYCRDYVTDRLWSAYRRLQVPVVSGGADYARTAIPDSYIDADNFTSARELADFLKLLEGDRELYNSYFRWTREYVVKETPVANWCQICEALHDKGREPQVYSDLAGWVAQDSCPLFSVSGDSCPRDLSAFLPHVLSICASSKGFKVKTPGQRSVIVTLMSEFLQSNTQYDKSVHAVLSSLSPLPSDLPQY